MGDEWKDYKEDDENMYNAVNKLVEILEHHEYQQEDDQHTKQVINKISDLITKMVDEEGDPVGGSPISDMGGGVTYSMEEDSTMPSQSYVSSPVRAAPEPTTELPHYPTPYELWKKSHEVAPRPKKPQYDVRTRRKIAEDVTKRLLNHQRKEHFSMMKTQHKKLAAELRGLTFAPDLKATEKINRKLVHGYEPLYRRYNDEIKKADIKRTKMEQQCRTQEMADCTFEPDCSKTLTRRQPGEPTVEDRCLQYGMERDVLSERRRDIIKRVEDKQLTFTPEITDTSRKIYEKLIAEGKAVQPWDRAKTYKVIGDCGDPGHEEDTFQPAINRRSHDYKDKKQSSKVFERLYSKAMDKESARRKKEGEYLDQHIRNVPKPFSARDMSVDPEFEGVALSGVERSELREKRRGNAGVSKSGKVSGGRGAVNVVTWNPKYSFLANQLGL